MVLGFRVRVLAAPLPLTTVPDIQLAPPIMASAVSQCLPVILSRGGGSPTPCPGPPTPCPCPPTPCPVPPPPPSMVWGLLCFILSNPGLLHSQLLAVLNQEMEDLSLTLQYLDNVLKI